MHKLYDSNYGYLVTYPCNNSKIIFQTKNNILICCSNYNKIFKYTNSLGFIKMVNKRDIYNDVFQLGKVISKELKELKYIGYKKDNISLFNITDKDIIESGVITTGITRFTRKYGMPENENNARINYDYQANNEKDSLNGIMDDDIQYKTINQKINIIEHTKNYNELAESIERNIRKTNEIKNRTNTTIQFNVLPFINLCLMIYYIKKLSTGLKENKNSTIHNLSKVFVDLEDKYEIENDKDKKLKVMRYLSKIQSDTNHYINTNFKYTNFERIIYPDLGFFKKDRWDDDFYIEKAFRITKYIVVVPILAAYDYLEQTLPYNNKTEIHCKDCGALLLENVPLCYDCRLIFYENVISDYRKSNSEKLRKKVPRLKKERDDYIKCCEDSPFNISKHLEIDTIYNSRERQSKYDNKQKN